MTTFTDKCSILAELYVDFKGEQRFADFFAYNDLGLPLAYAISTEIVKSTDRSQLFVEETFDVFLSSLGLEDEGWESLDDILVAASE